MVIYMEYMGIFLRYPSKPRAGTGYSLFPILPLTRGGRKGH